MKCLKCFRKITAKISVDRGYGPTCWKSVQAEIKQEKQKIIQQETPIFLTQNAFENVSAYVSAYIQPKTSLLATTKKIFNKIWAVKNKSDSYYKKYEIRVLNHLISTPI